MFWQSKAAFIDDCLRNDQNSDLIFGGCSKYHSGGVHLATHVYCRPNMVLHSRTHCSDGGCCCPVIGSTSQTDLFLLWQSVKCNNQNPAEEFC